MAKEGQTVLQIDCTYKTRHPAPLPLSLIQITKYHRLGTKLVANHQPLSVMLTFGNDYSLNGLSPMKSATFYCNST